MLQTTGVAEVWTFGYMNIMKIPPFILILAVVALIAGCERTKDPVAGWKEVGPVGYKPAEMSAMIDPIPGYKAISDDVQDYVNKLPVKHFPEDIGGGSRRYCYWITEMKLLEDGTGRHAVKIQIPVDGTWENYVLIYDKSNVRIKAIRFASGHYAC